MLSYRCFSLGGKKTIFFFNNISDGLFFRSEDICNDLSLSNAAPRRVEGLPGAERQHFHLDAGPLLHDRQQIAEQARILGRGRRGDDDRVVLRAVLRKLRGARRRGSRDE